MIHSTERIRLNIRLILDSEQIGATDVELTIGEGEAAELVEYLRLVYPDIE